VDPKKLEEWVEVIGNEAPDMPRPGVFKDASGIELISTESLLDGPIQEGDTVRVVAERTHQKNGISGFGSIEYFVIVDRGEPEGRPLLNPMFSNEKGIVVPAFNGNISRVMRFVVAPKAVGESTIDVEIEYRGVIIEGKYFSQDQAGSVAEHLNAISNTHEE